MSTAMETIPKDMCKNCTALSNIALAYNIKTIEEGAFSGCENLEISDLSPNVVIAEGAPRQIVERTILS